MRRQRGRIVVSSITRATCTTTDKRASPVRLLLVTRTSTRPTRKRNGAARVTMFDLQVGQQLVHAAHVIHVAGLKGKYI